MPPDRSSWPPLEDLVTTARRVAVPMLLGLLVATAVTIGAGLLVVGPLDGSLGVWDRSVVGDLAEGRTESLDRLTAITGLLADAVPVAVLWVLAMVVGARLAKRWEVAVFLLFAIGGEKLTFLVSSLVVDRPRPPVEPLGHVFGTGSFPSGHVGSSVTLYGGVAVAVAWHRRRTAHPLPKWSRVLCVVVVALIAATVAFGRAYRGQHFPSDLVWGALSGGAWVIAAWWVVLRRADHLDGRGSRPTQPTQVDVSGSASIRSAPIGPPHTAQSP